MPLGVEDGQRFQGDFSLAEVAGAALSDAERNCQDRVNGYIGELAAITDDGTPRGKELVRDRDFCVAQLRARAVELVAGTLTPDEMVANSFYYQGRFEEMAGRLATGVFQVSPEIRGGRYVGIQFDIQQGITSRDQLSLKRGLDEATTVVKVVLNGVWRSPRRRDWIERLVGIGRVGLMDGNFDLANDDLASMKNEFVARYAEAVKNRYIRRLGFWAFVWILICAALYVLDCRYLEPHQRAHEAVGALGNYAFLVDIAWRFRNFLLVAIGAAFGAWLSFLIQRPKLAFADLIQLDDDLLRPSMRVLFTIVLGTVVGLFFWTGLVAIKIGGFSTSFGTAGTPAVLIGAFAGLASRALAGAVADRAQSFAAGVQGRAQTEAPPAVAQAQAQAQGGAA